MLVIENAQMRQSNFTGLSLVLFLFLSLISMMAAYEASKPADEVRNSVIASFHEYSGQTADSESTHHAVVVAAASECAPTVTFHYQPTNVSSFAVPTSNNFDARGPPAQGFAAS